MHQCLAGERERERLLFTAFAEKKCGENSTHHRNLSLLAVRRQLWARKAWVLLLADLKTEFRSHYTLKRMIQLLKIRDLSFTIQKKRLRVTHV